MSMTHRSEENSTLRNAIKNGVVDTVLSPFANPLVTALMFDTQKDKGQHIQDPNTFEPYEHPRSTSLQVSSFPAITPDKTQYSVREVSRFVVPKGSVGFVEYIEQVVNDVAGNYYPTNRDYWGSPRSVLTDVDNIRWWLKLDYFDGQLPPLFQFDSAAAFGSELAPGMPYSDMGEIDSLWYPAHNNKRIKMIIPGARMLRMFYYSPPLTDFEWEVRARLTGYTQSNYSGESNTNARLLL